MEALSVISMHQVSRFVFHAQISINLNHKLIFSIHEFLHINTAADRMVSVVRVMQMDEGVYRLSIKSKHWFSLDLQQHTNFSGSTIAHHHTKHVFNVCHAVEQYMKKELRCKNCKLFDSCLKYYNLHYFMQLSVSLCGIVENVQVLLRDELNCNQWEKCISGWGERSNDFRGAVFFFFHHVAWCGCSLDLL